LPLGLALTGCQSGGHDSAPDLSSGVGGGGATDMGGPDLPATVSPDLSASSPDLSSPPADLSSPPGDMADGSTGVVGAQLRLVNAGSARLAGKDAGMLYSFDLYLAGGTTPIASGVKFGQSSPWTTIASGAGIKFDLRYAGDPATNAPLFTTAAADALTLSDGAHVSVVVYGISKTTSGGFKLLNLIDGFTAPPTGNAVGRFVNVSPAASGCKVYLDPNGAPNAQIMTSSASPAAGVALPAGADLPMLFTSTMGSTMFPASGDASWTLPSAVAANGKQLLLIVTGQGFIHPRDPQSVVLIVVDEATNAQVLKQDPALFIVATSPAAPALDLQTPSSPVKLSGLAYKQMQHLLLPAGAGVTINGSSAAQPLFSSATGPLAAGERYLGVIAGSAGAPTPAQTLQLRVYQEQFGAPAAMMARLRVINASPTAPSLDVGIYYVAGTFTPIQTAIDFPNASAAAGAQAAQKTSMMTSLSFGVGPTGNAAALQQFTYLSQFDPDDPLFAIPAGDWGATAAATDKKVVFVKAPIKSAWQASAPN
jgi:hypothetical protein